MRGHVDHDIDAATLGGRENLIQVTLGVVVEGAPGTEALHELPTSGVAGRAVHDGPDAMRKLHREGSHPAACTVDEHRFAGTHPRTHEQRVGRRQSGSAEARALLERNGVGKRGHGGGVADDELGIGAGAAAGTRRRHEHALPHVRSARGKVRPARVDDAGAVVAWNVGQLGELGVLARAQIGFHRVDAGGAQAHAHLALMRLGHGNALLHQRIRSAERAHHDRLHVWPCARFRHRTAPSAFVKTSLPFAARS